MVDAATLSDVSGELVREWNAGSTTPGDRRSTRRRRSNPRRLAAAIGVSVGLVLGGVGSLPTPATAGSSPAISPGGEASSRIWAGYAASDGATYQSISASWTVPTVLCIPGNDAAAAAQFAGLDGYGTPTVQQAGTGMKCNGGQASYWAWAELPPTPAIRVPFPVAPGDVVTVTITAESFSLFRATMSNSSTTHPAWTWTQTEVLTPSPRNWPTTAEVIDEAVPVGVSPVEALPTTAVVFTSISISTTGGAVGGFGNRFLWERIVRNGPSSTSAPGAMSDNGSGFIMPSPVAIGGPIAGGPLPVTDNCHSTVPPSQQTGDPCPFGHSTTGSYGFTGPAVNRPGRLS